MPQASPRQRALLALILGGYALLAVVYSLVTPLFEASDELWHYPMVQYVADHDFGLPAQDPASPGPWRQEGGQPPLYYYLGALLTRWIDTSDMEALRRINPHPDIGVVVPDGNANMVVHDAGREAFPWRGTALAMRLVRFLSVFMGLGTVLLTYALGRELFPAVPAIALGAATFTAFNPMFLFISGVINNDNLSTLLASALLLLIVRLIRRSATPPPLRTYTWLGVLAGLGMLAKYQIGFMLPLIALVLLAISLRARDWRPLVLGGLISGGLTVLIAGWWYWRNYDLYGDATGINIFLDIVGRRAVPADLRQLWTEREAFMMAFWGFFGGVNVPMRAGVYALFNLLAGISIVGLLLALAREVARRVRARTCPLDRSLYAARALTVVWAALVFASLLIWTRQTLASQGRLWFSAIAALNVWLAAGIAAWLPRRSKAQTAGLSAAALLFAAIAVLQPWTTIRPAYTLDRTATWPFATLERGAHRAACFGEPGTAQESLCAAYQRVEGTLRPGEALYLSPAMTVKAPLARDWSLFVHLVNENGTIEAQRDVYPGGGLLATSDLGAGEAWNNLVAVPLAQTIYAPQTLDIWLGFYDLTTFERMIPLGADADPQTDRLWLGRVTLEPPPGAFPNPVNADFGGELVLRGYEVTRRALRPGETTTVTLHWEARRRLTTDYTISAQIIDPDPASLLKAAQLDAPPDPPTTAWSPSAPVADTRALTIAGDAPPGRYRLLVRVYPAGDPAGALRVRGEAGAQSVDYVWLSWIQVE
ncbi:MAG: glycosyltransferase family 39 protein [Anaerolineae bacterium]|nr:glycosyltransferase family 39 protein [Anaerolineae bacterium]